MGVEIELTNILSLQIIFLLELQSQLCPIGSVVIYWEGKSSSKHMTPVFLGDVSVPLERALELAN